MNLANNSPPQGYPIDGRRQPVKTSGYFNYPINEGKIPNNIPNCLDCLDTLSSMRYVLYCNLLQVLILIATDF